MTPQGLESTFRCFGCRERCSIRLACSACGRCPDCHVATGCNGPRE